MTDNEIIKALECHKSNSLLDCEKCPLYSKKRGFANCHIDLFNSLYDLINRQKAEIERLKNLERNVYETVEKLANKIKVEARKEFAERLKERGHGSLTCCTNWVDFDDIDNLVKEMENDK